jgi:hypothetical protein
VPFLQVLRERSAPEIDLLKWSFRIIRQAVAADLLDLAEAVLDAYPQGELRRGRY